MVISTLDSPLKKEVWHPGAVLLQAACYHSHLLLLGELAEKPTSTQNSKKRIQNFTKLFSSQILMLQATLNALCCSRREKAEQKSSQGKQLTALQSTACKGEGAIPEQGQCFPYPVPPENGVVTTTAGVKMSFYLCCQQGH